MLTIAMGLLAANVRFRPSKPEAIWQIPSESAPERLFLILRNNVETIVVTLKIFILPHEFCGIESSISTAASSAFLAAAITTELLNEGEKLVHGDEKVRSQLIQGLFLPSFCPFCQILCNLSHKCISTIDISRFCGNISRGRASLLLENWSGRGGNTGGQQHPPLR